MGCQVTCPECGREGEYRAIEANYGTIHEVVHETSSSGHPTGLVMESVDDSCSLSDEQAKTLEDGDE